MKYKLLTFVLLICMASCACDDSKCKVDAEEQSTIKSVLVTTDSTVHLVDTTKLNK
jgi:hypothetical protein